MNLAALKQANINRLRNKGYRSYREYLESLHWQRCRVAYRLTGRPTWCVVCRSPRYELHHRSYSRIGSEWINDLIPLCRECHGSIHQYLNDHDGQIVQATPAILRRVFGWSKSEMHQRLDLFDGCEGRVELDLQDKS